MNEILKNCPCCGGEAEIISTKSHISMGDNKDFVYKGFIILCKECKLATPSFLVKVSYSHDSTVQIDDSERAEAINRWNSRK